ncbi:armadillo-type protein [Glomus cerebriforme]|uniref:Armadillo-type protein n=1 Tax=Glomus cerebriforme TaxID=658196 RepID=A0A397TF31_9GLOM|nr:armadillo-type protein [Glomus cerebriforme]
MDIQLRALLGRCIYILLEIISNEKLLLLRLISLETLQSLVNNIEDSGIIAAFLPGMVSTLSKTLIRDQKENHMLLAKIVETLSEVIASVMKDEDKNSKTTSTQPQQSILASICVERTKSWLKATKSQIKILISQIFTIRNHSAWQLRLAFVNFSYKLLSCSAKCLDNCISILIETLVFYLNDDYEQVSIPCRQNLDLLRSHSEFKDFTPILKENFDSWLTSLPRYLIGLDENAKFNALSLIAGFITLLGSDIQTVMNISLQRISDGLLNALEFDTGDVQVVENRFIIGQYDSFENDHFNSLDVDTLPSFSQPQYKHIREQRVKTCVSRVFRLFGYFTNLSFLIDHFLAYFRDQESSRFYVQSRSILREYVESDAIRGLINIVDSSTKAVFSRSKFAKQKILATPNMSIESQNYIILINCFILEGIAVISRILGVEFRLELMDALYPILEKLGEDNMLVHETADITLTHVSIWCGYSSKKAIVLENVDYLVNVISQKLNQVVINPQAPQVLTAMIHVVGPPVLPFMDDSIEEIFDALDSYHMNSYLLNQLANVLFAVIITIAESIKEEKKEVQDEVNDNSLENKDEISKKIAEFIIQYKAENESETRSSRSNVTLEEIGQYFLERQESKKKEIEDDDLEVNKRRHDPTGTYHDDEDTNKKSNPTKSQTICLKIIDKLLHLLTATSPQLRSLVLDIIRISLPILRSIPNEVYPLIHRIWPSVVNRLKDQEPYVVLSAVKLIQEISISSGDFFTSRVVQDVWPSFQQLLRQQSMKDEEYLGIATTTYSRSHRLKKSILETIKTVINKVVLSNQILFQIMDSMWPFLNEEVHEELQTSAIGLFKELAKRNANATWLILRGLVEEYSIITYNKIVDEEVELSDILWPKYLCRFTKGKGQFVKNVKLILNTNLF